VREVLQRARRPVALIPRSQRREQAEAQRPADVAEGVDAADWGAATSAGLPHPPRGSRRPRRPARG
jgi:hypothetical protein